MKHENSHPLAGKTVKIKAGVIHPQLSNFGGSMFKVEDYWDKIAGESWMFCDGNPACLIYAMRSGLSDTPIPTDDEVLYGKSMGLGHLVHVSEIEVIDAE